MALRIVEFFGYPPLDPASQAFAEQRQCPFINGPCIKPEHGSCSLEATNGVPVICCPNRLYANAYVVLSEVANLCFGKGCSLVKPDRIRHMAALNQLTGKEVAVFGRYWGQELPIPRPRGAAKGASNFYVDWVLARVNSKGDMEEFTAVEVQTIDTTGNYSKQAEAFFAGEIFHDRQGRRFGFSNSGFNWENVSKRILPQLIYKGHVLRRESKCSKGIFFVCPSQVLNRIRERLGGNLEPYPIGNGTITFRSYELGPVVPAGQQRDIVLSDTFTTTVDQIAYAFVSPTNLPTMGVYEAAIKLALDK